MEIKELPDKIIWNKPEWNNLYEKINRWKVLKEFVATVCNVFITQNTYIRDLNAEIEFCKNELFKLKYTSLPVLLHDFKYTELKSLRTDQQKHIINLVKSYYKLRKEIIIQSPLFFINSDSIRETGQIVYISETQFVGNLTDYLDLKYPKKDVQVTLS